MSPFLRRAAFSVVAGLVAGMSILGLSRCGNGDTEPTRPEVADRSTQDESPTEPAAPTTPEVVREEQPFPDEAFTWIASATGSWTHQTSNSGEYRMPEIMCGGVVLLDFDGDDDLDVFAAQGGTWPDLADQADRPYPGHALFRNDGAWRFTDVAKQAGVFGTKGVYGHGGVAADYDADGDVDLFVTGYERNVLYRNRGDGTFEDATDACGMANDHAFSVSACWLDGDRDGHLDLYVVNYIEYTHEYNRTQICGKDSTGFRDYCSPRVFNGVQDFYYHNQGDGTFVEKATEVGLASPQPIRDHSKGLGVIATDADGDGDPDIYVANDSTHNLLFLNDGTGHFEEEAFLRGCALNNSGIPQAGMGLDAGDFDRDGDFDLWVVHLDSENNALYRNNGKAEFSDSNEAANLWRAARGNVGFGTDLFDFDHDADLDIAIAHGHVLMHAEARQTITYKQSDHLLEQVKPGRFQLVEPERAGYAFSIQRVSRGLATGDLDGDGDLDLVISARDDAPAFLRNNHERVRPANTDAVMITLRTNGRTAIGARVTVTTDVTQHEEVRAGGSYASCSASTLHFGLGDASKAAVTVRWPDGTEQDLGTLDGGTHTTWEQGSESPLTTAAFGSR